MSVLSESNGFFTGAKPGCDSLGRLFGGFVVRAYAKFKRRSARLKPTFLYRRGEVVTHRGHASSRSRIRCGTCRNECDKVCPWRLFCVLPGPGSFRSDRRRIRRQCGGVCPLRCRALDLYGLIIILKFLIVNKKFQKILLFVTYNNCLHLYKELCKMQNEVM